MQITLKSSKVAKTGENKNGTWKLIVVVDEITGIEYTTFDTKANAGAGAVLEIGEPDVKNGKFSFKKCELISGAPANTGSNGAPNGKEGARSSMSPEDWAKKDRIERASYEAQTAFKGIISLQIASCQCTENGGIIGDADKFKKVFNEALDWASAHLKTTPASNIKESKIGEPKKEGQAPPRQNDPELGDPPGFKNVGEFFTACQANGVERSKALELIGVADKDAAKINTEDAWLIIQEYIAKENKELWG